MESMLFVFGKRAKRMRLNKLSELIHNSTTMNDLRFASVTIYFKEIRDLPDGKFEEIPNSHFILSREVFKNSSSKYLLDNQEISFEKLCGILEKKGIDLKHNRFLILQGEVEQISMMKPKAINSGDTGLLEYLEDIIGTTRFVNLIEKFGKNIDELSEIKQQKANRLKHLRNELNQLEDIKNNATEYYKKEKQEFFIKNIENVILCYENNMDLQKINLKIADCEKQIEEVEKKKKQKISEQTSTLEEIKKMQLKINNIERELKRRHHKTDELDEIDRTKRNEIDNIGKNISKIKVSLEKSNKNYNNFSELILLANNDLPKKEEILENYLEEKEILEKIVKAREAEIFEKTQKLQIKKRDLEMKLEPFETKINQNKFTIDQNNSTINLLSENSKKLSLEVNQLSFNKGNLLQSVNLKKNNLQNYNKRQEEIILKLNTLRNEFKKIDIEEKELNKHISILHSKILEIKHNQSERIQRSTNLESLMRAQDQGVLSGIYGRLGDLGSIEAEYDIAITSCCGHLNSIVVEKIDHATKAVEYLRANNLGRMTFIVLEKQIELENRMYSFNKSSIQQLDCQRLFDLVKIKNQRLAPAFYFALKDTLVCKDLPTASKIAYGQQRHRVVTLNGELIEAFGTMSGGGKPKKGGMSNKVIEDNNTGEYLNKLQSEHEEIIKDFQNKRNERINLENHINSYNQNIQEIRVLSNQLDIDLGIEEKQLSDINKKLDILCKEIEKQNKNKEEMQRLNNLNNHLEGLNIELIQKSTEHRNDLEKIEIEINKIYGDDHKKNNEDLKQVLKNIDTIEKEIHKYKNVIENAPLQIQKSKNEIETKENSIKIHEEAIDKIKKELEEIEKIALETYGQIEILNREKENINNTNSETSKAISVLKEEVAKIHEEKDKINAEINEWKNENKKFIKREKTLDYDLEKNKDNFKKFMDEYGFIDDFEKEIKRINRPNNIIDSNDDENKMNIESGETECKNNHKSNMDIEDSQENNNQEENTDINRENNTIENKIAKLENNYEKYIDSKFIDYRFKAEELEELYKFKVSNLLLFFSIY